jgi:chemotaxis protein MotB
MGQVIDNPAGRTNAKPEMAPELQKIAARVEGHTDNAPLPADSKFETNWELSTARAIWIVRYMRAKFGIPTSRLSAAGFAEGQPLANNQTEDGRAINRRVEIVVTNLQVGE